MIEFGVGPVIRIVAVAAVATEIAFVDIVLNVAGLALLRRITSLAIRLVATFAIGIGVFAQQLEIRQQMVKRRFVEPHDVCVAALMIGMAGRTLCVSDVRGLTVKSAAGGNVIGNILMAVKAQRPLLRSVEWFVAGRTLRLELGMPAMRSPGMTSDSTV